MLQQINYEIPHMRKRRSRTQKALRWSRLMRCPLLRKRQRAHILAQEQPRRGMAERIRQKTEVQMERLRRLQGEDAHETPRW